jgi:ATP-dependent exoDNAse (exonuclease V) beta subunit
MEYVDGSNGDGRETLPRPEDLAPLPACAAPILTPHSLTDDNQVITASTGRSSRPVGDHGALGKMRGLLVHSCLEDSVYRPGEATEQRIKYTLARAGMLSEDHVSWLREELSHHLSGFRRAAPEALLGEEQGAVFRELPFRLPLPPPNQGQSGEGGWLEGVIDLLYRDEQQQRWIVVDYKSDKAPPEVLVDKYRSQLLAYAWAVSCILPELSDPQWTVETQLLFTAHGERRTVSGPATRSEIENQFRDLLSTQP